MRSAAADDELLAPGSWPATALASGCDPASSCELPDPALAASQDPADAARLLRSYQPAFASERVARARMLTFLEAHQDAFSRRCVPGHFTASALVLDAARERVLLLHHHKLDRWLQPGGHADGDTNLPAVALREASEESGISGLCVARQVFDLDVHEIPARANDPAHLHLDVRFLVLAPPAAVLRRNHESRELRWCTPAEAWRLGADDSVRRLVIKAFAPPARGLQ